MGVEARMAHAGPAGQRLALAGGYARQRIALPTARALVSSQVAIESFQLSPDGEWVVYAARTVQRGTYRSHIWVVPWQGGRARQLTRGNVRDSAPSIGSGGLVAFVRSLADDPRAGTTADRPDREPQVWIEHHIVGHA